MIQNLTPLFPLKIFVLPVLTGLLYWLSSQPLSMPLLVWICLVPFGCALYGTTGRGGFLSGLVAGFSIWFSATWWLSIQLDILVHLPQWQAWCGAVAFALFQGLPYAIFGFLAGRFRWMERPFGPWITAAALVTIITWFPKVFPGNETHNLYEWPLFIQVLDLGGVPLLQFCLYAVNFLAARAVMALWGGNAARPVSSLVSITVILTFMAGYGAFRLNDIERQKQEGKGQHIVVTAVQPNVPVPGAAQDVPLEDKDNDMRSALAYARQAGLRHPNADLLVLPEIPCGYSCVVNGGVDLPVLAKETGQTVMVPCTGMAKPAGRAFYNSVAYVDRRGSFGEEYRKMILTPFGEYLPLEHQFPFLRRMFPGVMPFVPGERVVVYHLGDGRSIIPSLCYEAVFTDHIRRFVREGGNVLVNMVNDAWFGKTKASLVHMSLALYRTVEYRIPMVRATNSGLGIFVDSTGRIIPGSKTPLFEKAVSTYPLFIPDKRSPYYHLGDLFLYGLSFCFVIILAGDIFRKSSQEVCSV